MINILRKSLAIVLMLLIFSSSAYARTNLNMLGNVNDSFSVKYKDLPDKVSFKLTQSKTIPDIITIPENSTVTLQVIRAQRELRWHKSGLILCKLISFTPETTNIPVDVSDKNLYMTVRKYEELNKKEAWILGTEIVVMQGASMFAPGVDIGYFFIKGAIQRDKHSNWFKAGVRNAYDNSILWFPEKGKPIELSAGDKVQIKDIKQKKAEKLVKKIDKRTARFERQAAKRLAKKEDKYLKKELKKEKKLAEYAAVEDAMEEAAIEKSVLAEIFPTEKSEKRLKTEN